MRKRRVTLRPWTQTTTSDGFTKQVYYNRERLSKGPMIQARRQHFLHLGHNNTNVSKLNVKKTLLPSFIFAASRSPAVRRHNFLSFQPVCGNGNEGGEMNAAKKLVALLTAPLPNAE